jgi:hypothetical protein
MDKDFAQTARDATDALERPVIDPQAEETEAARPVLYKFTNHKESAALDNLLATFYVGVMGNSLGIMHAHNIETGEEEIILVGIELDADGKPDCYPLARCLDAETARLFLAPDGKGGFYDPRDPADTADAKENMRSFNEAVVN